MLDWNELVHAEGPAVWRVIQRLVQNRADADECLQETFLAAMRFSEREAVVSHPALLRRLAVARAVDCLRRRARQRSRERQAMVAELDGTADPRQQSECAELANELRAALAKLPARSAEMFCLSELEEWTHGDIGREFGLTANAVGVIIHRAKHRLRKLLKANKGNPA